VTVWTDLYWDSDSTWLSDGSDGFVLGLKTERGSVTVWTDLFWDSKQNLAQ